MKSALTRFSIWTGALFFLQACGDSPKVAHLEGSAPRLSSSELADIARLQDKDSINFEAPARSSALQGSMARTNEQRLTAIFHQLHQIYDLKEVDFSNQLPPVRDQSCLPICNLVTDSDLVSGSVLKNGKGLSILNVAQLRDPESHSIRLHSAQDDLLRLSAGGEFWDEASMPFDPDLFNPYNKFYEDLVDNFLANGAFFYKKFISPFYDLDAAAISKSGEDSNGPLDSIKIDVSGLKNKAKSRNKVRIPPFKVVNFYVDLEDELWPGVAEEALIHLFHALYELNNPVALGICWNQVLPYIKSYHSFVADEDTCGRHAVLLVGVETVGSTVYFKLRNSHGLEFGSQGYALLSVENFFHVLTLNVPANEALEFLYVDTERETHKLQSELFSYEGELAPEYMPHGWGTLTSHAGGQVQGYFDKGECKGCEKGKDPYVAADFWDGKWIIFSITRPKIDFQMLLEGFDDWTLLRPQVEDEDQAGTLPSQAHLSLNAQEPSVVTSQ